MHEAKMKNEQKAIQLRESGKSYQQIARSLGVSVTVVLRWTNWRSRLGYVLVRSQLRAKRGGHKPCTATVDELLNTKADRCAICSTKHPVLCLDHDHKTGRFRGWLCQRCNKAIGALGDDLRGLNRAVLYLRRWS